MVCVGATLGTRTTASAPATSNARARTFIFHPGGAPDLLRNKVTPKAIGAILDLYPRGRIVGKAMTSRIEALSVSSITSRSMPMPSPPAGRHAVFERGDEILVQALRLLVAKLALACICAAKRAS